MNILPVNAKIVRFKLQAGLSSLWREPWLDETFYRGLVQI